MDGGAFPLDGISTNISDVEVLSEVRESEIVATLVASELDRAEVIAIRSTVWMTAPGARFSAHFDPNDWCSTHVVVRVDGEPAGTLRIRWFPDAPRFERMAIREEFRSLRVFRALVNYAMALCAAKGYRKVIGMSRDAKGVTFWRRIGGQLAGPPVEWNGEMVYPMKMTLTGPVHPALARGADAAGEPEFERALCLPEAELVAC